MITIRSINGEILTHFDNSVPDGNPYFEPVMTDDMESLVSSFSFSVPLEVEDSVYLQGLNQVLTKDRYGDLRLFIITDVYEEWTTVGGSVKVDCEDISISEMNDIVVSPFNGISFEDTLNKTFNNSGWTLQYGANWKDVDNTTFVLEEYDNMRSVIASIIDTYGCQFKFLAQENQYGEITRVAEVFKTRGVDTGKYFYYDRDLLGIERDIQHSNIKTAIHPYYTGYNGKTYTLYDFYPVNPDPDFQKDKKSTLIINKEASKLYDDGNSYRIMPYKAEVEGDPELVYREAIKELKKYEEPIYTYKVNVILLQNLYGWDGEDIELGDTVWMKERVGRRELGLEARVTAYEYHEDDPSADVVTFSNFKEIDTTDAKEIAERIFIAYANSADGKVDFSIDDSTNRAYMGVYTSATKTQSTDPDTYTWSRTKGEDGNSAPTLDLTSSQQVMKLKSDGTPDGEQAIIFTAIKQNSTEAIVWEAIPYKGNLVQPPITLDGSGDVKTLKSSQWDKDWTRLQVTVTMGALKDIQTIVMVSDGATGASGTAVVGFLTNESTTFAASSDGTVADYTNGNGRFVIYEGTKEVTSGVVYSKESNVGINLLINSNTGEYIVSNMTQDQAQAVVKAVYKEVTITKFLSFSKSRQGQTGASSNLHTAWAHVGEFPEFVKGAKPNEYRISDRIIMVSNNASTFPVISTFMMDEDGTWFSRVTRDKLELNPSTLSLYNTITVSDDMLEQSLVGKRVMISAKFRSSTPVSEVVMMSAYVTPSGTTNLPLNGVRKPLTTDFVEFSDVIEDWKEGTHTLRFCPREPVGLSDVGGLKFDMTGFRITILESGETPKPEPWIPPLSRDLKNPTNIFTGGNTRDFLSASNSVVTNTHGVSVPAWGVTDAVTTTATGGSSQNRAQLPVNASGSYLADGKTGYTMSMYVRNNSTTEGISLIANGAPYNQNQVRIPPNTSGRIYLPYFVPSSGSAIVFQVRTITAGTAVDFTWSKPEIYEYNIKHGFTINPPQPNELEYLGVYSDGNVKGTRNPADYSWSLVKGTDGTDGAPAQLLTVQSDTPVMRFDSTDTVISGQVVTFNAFKQGIESGIIWKATPYKGNTAQPDITLGGTGDTRTLNGSQWASGVTTIKVTVNAGGFTDTVTITKVKDGAKGDKGDSGADGIAGKDGVGLKSTTVNYAPSASGTVAPASGWQAQVPTVAPNNFLWTRTEWTYTDNSTEVGYSVAKMGADGAKGDDGIAGKDGVGIDETLIEYASSASGTVKPTSGWSTSIPVVPAGQYLWTRTTWTYTDGTNEQGFTVAKQGEKGDKGDTGASGKDGIAGKDGVGIASTAISYAGSSNGTTAPVTGWQEQVPTVDPNNFLWTRTVWTYTDNSTETGYSVAKMGADGAKGDDGIAGKDGVGIVSTVIEYATSTSGTTKPLTGWTTTVPTVPQGNFLWTRTTWNYSDDTSEQGFTVARQGSNGSNGADAYSPILTNESTTFAASPTGVVTDWSVGNGVFMVYRGTTRVTTGVTYAVESVSNSEGTINASTGAYSITNLTKDNGTITFKATIGSVVLTKTMSLSKSRQGLEGAQGAQGIQGVRGVAIYNPTEPSGNIEEGATWFQTESATNDLVIAMYTRKNGIWVKTPVAAGALQVEQLSAISADIGNVTAGNILGIKITGSEFLQTWNIDQGTEVQKGETRLYNGAIRQIDSVTNKTTGNERVYSTATISNGEINGTRNVKWDDGSIRQLANLTISGSEIRMYNSEEGVGYQGTITAKALTNLGWKTLQMGSLFEAKEGNPPQYKINWQLDGTRIIKFRGQFGLKSGNMTASTSYYPFRSENTPSSGTSYVPAEITPNRTAFGYGATSAYHGGRLAMTTAPNLLFNSAESVTYCSLETFQYIIE